MSSNMKPFKTYEQQVDVLQGRGMLVGSREHAVQVLERVNYYRFSGYSYAFRQKAGSGQLLDTFIPGTTFEDVETLYEYDRNLRFLVFSHFSQFEVYLRSRLGYLLGEVDPLIYEDETLCDCQGNKRKKAWNKFTRKSKDLIKASKEAFVEHHYKQYGGKLPVWVVVEVLDFGALQNLYSVSPRNVREGIAKELECTDPQLATWLNSLRVVRNICAHQGRLYNKLYPEPYVPRVLRGGRVESPKIREVIDLFGVPQDEENTEMSKTFGMLTLLKYLMDQGGIGDTESLTQILKERPNISVPGVDISRAMGIPQGWEETRLWS
ncbi:MAG: Abi family protein [Rothia mucilaginosa]|jgi:abortive infection bacteriophage resistance protein|uniref:Abi family protein n=1 Tax=Rothia sp. HMSC072B03 TaxID=1715109 RepID=UPI0008A46ABC|nr:Abi family protein [Rothia sp. HMSC072B03]MDU2571004.1 Abi family protein [Rothia mucilaginosa]OFM97444.1 abortive phage resistance protein [Rothia sp. HMSC072B03]